ncbi:MAG TPA: hypothetical protein V6D25_30360, partial [Leptolyngbyaceae cyanobacterium]
GKSQLSPSLTSLALSIGQGMFRFSPAIPLNTDLSTGERVSLLAGIGDSRGQARKASSYKDFLIHQCFNTSSNNIGNTSMICKGARLCAL